MFSGLCKSGEGRYIASGGCIAQLVEQLTLNQRVVGSNPTAPTITLSDFRLSVENGPWSFRVICDQPLLEQGLIDPTRKFFPDAAVIWFTVMVVGGSMDGTDVIEGSAHKGDCGG